MKASRDPHDMLNNAIGLLADLPDPGDRAAAITQFMTHISQAGEELKDIRRNAMLELHAAGLGYGAIADIVGISKARAQQVITAMTSPPRPGKIEMETRIAAAELRAANIPDPAIAVRLLPFIRSFPGGDKLTNKTIAAMLDMPVKDVTAANAALRKKT
jgi:hypothetical protein